MATTLLGPRLAATIALLLTILSSGCSLLTVTKPPPGPVDATKPVQCTTNIEAPISDTIASLVLMPVGALTIAVGSGDSAFTKRSEGTIWAGIGIAAVGAVSLVSAGFGYAWTSECRELKSQQLQQQCLSGVEESCAALRVVTPATNPRKER